MSRAIYLGLILGAALAHANEPFTSGNWVSRAQAAAVLTVDPPGWDEIREIFALELIGPGAYASASNEHSHEVESVRDVGALLQAKRGSSLALISRWNGTPTPTFDGVVVDGAGQVIANFSLKRRFRAVAHATKAYQVHLDDLALFATSEGWVTAFVRRGLRTRTGQHPVTKEMITRHEIRNYKDHLDAHAFLHRIFVTTPPRPSWLIIDYGSAGLTSRGLTKLHSTYAEHQPGVTVMARVGNNIRSYCEKRLGGL